ncbi:MAG: glycosyltransferase family 2 protein [Elusimicrobiota bacterium]
MIVNYNGMEYLPECLRAVRGQTYGWGYEIIVVNNLSTDGSREYLLRQKDVRLIDPGENTGFSGGQNLGILAARGEYVLCLNFDCYLDPEFLKTAAEVFKADPSVGSISGKLKKLIDHKKTDFIDSTGIAYTRCVPADRGEWTNDGPQWDKSGWIFGPSGAAGCYRRAALEDVRFEDEYFDEDMFIYCEDVDIAWRLNLRGWRSWYESSAQAYHERGSTRRASSPEKRNYYVKGFRNRYMGWYKNLRYDKDIRPNWKKLLRQEVWSALGFAKHDPLTAIMTLKAILGAFSSAILTRRMRQKRRFIQTRLNDQAFSLDFDSAVIAAAGHLCEANLYALAEEPSFGQIIHDFESIRSVNLVKEESECLRGALASGISKRIDPQFVVSVPEGIRRRCSEYLEFDLYSSHDSRGQIFWLRGSGFCRSADFAIGQGRRRYLIDLEALKVVPDLGNPSVRKNPERLRIDPADKNDVTVGIFSLRLLENPKKASRAVRHAFRNTTEQDRHNSEYA